MAYRDPAHEILPPLKISAESTLHFFHNQTVSLDTTDSSNPSRWSLVVFEPRPGSNDKPFNVPSHWHMYHDEFWTVYEGRATFTVDGKAIVVKAGDPVATAMRGQVHSIEAFAGERLVFTESTRPGGAFKEAFFRDLFQKDKEPDPLLAFRAFQDGDTYPSTGFKSLDRMLIFVLGGIAQYLAPANPYAGSTLAAQDGKAKMS